MSRKFKRAADWVTFVCDKDAHGTGTHPGKDKKLGRGDDTYHRPDALPRRLANGHKRREHACGEIDYAVGFTIGQAEVRSRAAGNESTVRKRDFLSIFSRTVEIQMKVRTYPVIEQPV